MHPKLKKYFDEHPVVEVYRGYEIRAERNDSYIVDAALAIYSMTTSSLKCCYDFIDELADHGINQYDDENVSRYLIERERKKYSYLYR